MIHTLWTAILYRPFVNLLAALISIIPGGDVGIAIILLTILVKVVLYPISQRQIVSQAKMTLLTPELNQIKQSGASKEEQAKLTFDLYKKHKTNPFSGCLLVLIQIPIIFALYYVFFRGINFDNGILYSFVHAPEHLNMNFLGLIDISAKSVLLAVLAGVSQYLQAHFMPKPAASSNKSGSLGDSFSNSMQLQMKYIFPFLIAFIAYRVSGAIALYWIISNSFAVGQQIYAQRKRIAVTVHGERLETEVKK
jgi:YidC/Oxa1 family membrane protein insertase